MSQTLQMCTSVFLFFAVAYLCARDVGIEHPWVWYRGTRMKNYDPERVESLMGKLPNSW